MIPGLRYADAPAAIEWLCSVLGFEKHAVHAGPDGSIAHAELTFGGGMVMLGSSAHSTPLDESGHANAPSIYLIAADTDSVYARAKGAGAKMVLDIEDKDYGDAVSAAAILKATSGAWGATILWLNRKRVKRIARSNGPHIAGRRADMSPGRC